MRFGKISLAAVAALSLLSAPVMAQSASAASKAVGVSKVKRVGATATAENKQDGSSGLLIGLAAAAAVIVGIVVLSDDDSTSP